MPGNTGNGFDKRKGDINMKGRPPEPFSWSGLLKQFGEQELEGKTKKEWIAEALFQEALKGNVPAIKEYGDRVEGKALQKNEVTGKDGTALELIIKKL